MALTDEFRDGLSRVIDGSCSLLYSADVLWAPSAGLPPPFWLASRPA